jgi:hypothetical protein
MKRMIVAALLALSAGIALAGDVTPYDKELAAQMIFPKKATPKVEPAPPAVATAATPCTCICKH